jgi:hypothetical protein
MLEWRSILLEQQPDQVESILLKFTSHTLDWEGLFRFMHSCNLLVGFPYFVNAKSFAVCLEEAVSKDYFSSNASYNDMKMFRKLGDMPSCKRLFMDKFGIFFDLVKIENEGPIGTHAYASNAYWLDKFEAMGSESYLLICECPVVNKPDCHVVRARGFDEARQWVFDSFDTKVHRNPNIGEMLSK